jgi:hypothetical protein
VARLRSSAANAALTASCLALAALSVRNVYGDASEVERSARESASCPEPLCQLARVERTPFSQRYEFVRRGETLVVRCARSALLLGPYECSRGAP